MRRRCILRDERRRCVNKLPSLTLSERNLVFFSVKKGKICALDPGTTVTVMGTTFSSKKSAWLLISFGLTVICVSFVSFSAIAGIIGGGGLEDAVYRFGSIVK